MYDAVDIDGYTGLLLDKGNSVYVTGGPEDYEVSGASEIIKQIVLDGFWNVVPDTRYAHFIIEYHVDTDGADKGYIIIKDAKGGRMVSGFSGSKAGASESISENRETARAIYRRSLQKLQKQILENRLPPEFSSYRK